MIDIVKWLVLLFVIVGSLTFLYGLRYLLALYRTVNVMEDYIAEMGKRDLERLLKYGAGTIHKEDKVEVRER